MRDKDFIEKGLFKNCFNIEETEQGIIPLRFTEKQLNLYKETSNWFEIASRCPAGIYIDFKTDSKFIKFNYTIRGKMRDWVCFDIYVDNFLIESIGNDSTDSNRGNLYYEIPYRQSDSFKMKQISIYFPNNVELVLYNFKISESATIEPIEKFNKNILCLGDSITQGMDAYNPSLTYPVLISRTLKMNLINQGVGGYVFNKDSIDKDIPFKPEVITVAYGTNDWRTCETMSQFNKNCSKYMKHLVKSFKDAKIFVITPLWRIDLYEQKKCGSFFEIIQNITEICKEHTNISVLNGLDLIPHMPRFFGDKRVHPNNEGFLNMAMNIISEI